MVQLFLLGGGQADGSDLHIRHSFLFPKEHLACGLHTGVKVTFVC